jgi:hypothetical protein
MYKLVIRTGADGQPRIAECEGPLLPDATYTVTGGADGDGDEWTQLIVINDVVIDTGQVTGHRIARV